MLLLSAFACFCLLLFAFVGWYPIGIVYWTPFINENSKLGSFSVAFVCFCLLLSAFACFCLLLPAFAFACFCLLLQFSPSEKTCNVDFGVGGIFCGVAKMLIQDKVCFWDIEGASRKKIVNELWWENESPDSELRDAVFSSLTYLWILKIQIVIYDKSDFTTFLSLRF